MVGCRSRVIPLLLALATLPAWAGCQSPGVRPPAQAGSYLQPHSLVIDPPPLQAAVQQAHLQTPPSYPPWWASRNDVRPAVAAGYDSPTQEAYFQRTWDRQYHIHGRVFNTYNQRSLRLREKQGVR